MKKLLVSLGALVALLFIVFVGLIAYVVTFDANANKDWIAAQFLENTGRELVLGGNIELTLYPWAGITVDNVSISNAPGFSATPLLQAEHLQARVKLLPMLNGSYEIDTVQLHGARLNLEVLGNGENNWTLGGNVEVAPDSDQSAAGRDASYGGTNLIIGGVDIQDAAIIYDDQFANTHYEINNLDMGIGELVYGAPLNISLSLAAASRSPQLNVTTEVAGTVVYDVDNGRYDLDPLTLEATLRGPNVPNGSAAINLTTALTVNMDEDTLSLRNLEFDMLDTHLSASLDVARASTESPAVSGNLTLTGDDLAVLFRILEQNALAERIGSLSSSFDIAASIDADMETGVVNVPTLQAELLGADIEGALSASRMNTDSPAFSGKLTAAGPDLPTLIEVLGMLQGSDSALSQTGKQLREGIRNRAFTFFSEFNGDLAQGNVQVTALEAAMFGFTLNGTLDASDINDGGSIDGSLTLEGNNLREVLTALGQTGLGEVAQSMKLDVQVSGRRDNLSISPLNLDLVLSGEQIPNSPQTLAYKGDTVLNLDDANLSIDAFTLSGLGLNLTGSVSATNIGENAAFAGRLAVPAFNARRLLEQLNQPVNTADSAALNNVALDAGFKGTTNSLNLDGLTLTLDDSKITGTLALSDLNAMNGSFTVSVDTIDADRYLAPVTENTQTEPAAAEPLPVAMLKTLNLQGAVNVGQLTISGLKMSNIVVELKAANGNVALNPIRADLYQGTFAGDITLDVTGAEPLATANTTLTSIALGPLTQDFMDADYLTGTGDIKLALTGRGTDSAQIKRNLSGSGSLGVADGVLSGVDVEAVLRQVELMIRTARLQDLPQGGTTAFDKFSATLAIDAGVVNSNDLLISAPGWSVAGTGTLADLNDDSINFDLVTSIDPGTATSAETEYDLGGYTLPIACNGSFTSPRCLPDAAQIIAGAVRGAVQRRLGDFLEDRLGGGTQQQQAAPTDTTQEAKPTEAAPVEEEPKPEEELLNRALDLLRR